MHTAAAVAVAHTRQAPLVPHRPAAALADRLQTGRQGQRTLAAVAAVVLQRTQHSTQAHSGVPV
jgi:hypothetical protein